MGDAGQALGDLCRVQQDYHGTLTASISAAESWTPPSGRCPPTCSLTLRI
jgi:hypothetical protein